MKTPDGRGKVLVNPSGGLTFGGHFVGGSNIFSAWSARREMLEKGFARGLVHGTGSTVAQYGVAMVLERR
jgi:acetyl-CoA acetyltransferase